MKYKNLKNKLNEFKHILVTGPQRSGTTITGRIIAKDLNYQYVDEEQLNWNSLQKMFENINSNTNNVIQCPMFTSIIHWIDSKNTAIVFMKRDINEIIKSQKRIMWSCENLELRNYFIKEGTISDIKYKNWEDFQKPYMKIPFFELDYKSLENHKLWIDKQKREKFHAKQWTQNIIRFI